MKKKALDQLYIRSYKNGKEFINLATDMLTNYAEAKPGTPELTAARIKDLAKDEAISMAIGAEFKKNQYIITGIVIGVALTGLVIVVKNKLDKEEA